MPADGRPGIRAIRKLLRHRLGMTGLAILLVYGAVALLAPLLAPFDPDDVNLRAVARAPNLTHWLGTDQFGRDILSRIMYGARTSLLLGFGDQFDEAALRPMPPGSVFSEPAGHKHFARTQQEPVVLQLTEVGGQK